MEEINVSNLTEVTIKQFYHKFKIQTLQNGNKQLAVNSGRSVVLDVSNKNILFNVGIDFKLLVSLNLSNCELSCLPDIFDYDNHLKELNLSHNKFTEVPEAVFKFLGLLEQLDLSHNQIAHFNGLPKCTYKLRVLRLNNNCFINIPEFILKVCCLNLEELYYSFNEIVTMSTSKFLYRGPYRLKKLEIKNCIMRSQDLKYLKQIRTLKELDISNEVAANRNCIDAFNTFENFFINALWDDQMIVLRLNDLQISDLPMSLCNLTALRELYLSKNDLMWLPDLYTLEELRVLDVSENRLVSLPNNISKFKKLEVLKVACNNISEVPDFKLLNLKHLDLYDNNLDHFSSLNWNSIHFIDLEYNYFSTVNLPSNKYTEKKIALRQGLILNRKDGAKEQPCCESSDEEISCSVSEDEIDIEDCHLGEFKPGYVEESWSSSTEDCDNGCTPSDNEWTGFENASITRKTKKRHIARPPSWMLEDTD